MQFISESIIDQKAEEIGSAEDLADQIQDLKENQPAILSYLLSESFDLLTESEKEYTMFLVLVVWTSVDEVHPKQKQINPDDIEKAEDTNWEKFSAQKVKEFREKLNVFFDKYLQEDLLAFVEDALVHDEDETITEEGREYIFIALKTIIDCLNKTID